MTARFIVVLFIFSSSVLKAQFVSFNWVQQVGDSSNNAAYSDIVKQTVLDGFGNFYSIGEFFGTVDFDLGSGTNYLTSNGQRDVFIQKLDSNGSPVWVRQLGGTSQDYGYALTTDQNGNVYATGGFIGTVDFDPESGVSNLTSASAFNSDIFIQKLDSSGSLVWAKSIGGSSWELGWSIECDEMGHVCVSGTFRSTVDFDPGAGVHSLTSNGVSDSYVLKLDTNGNFKWAAQMGGPNEDFAIELDIDGLGNIYTTGFFEDTVDFDPGPGVVTSVSNGARDVFVQKLDSSGNFVWAKTFGSGTLDIGHSITLDDNGGVYSAGYFQDTVDFDPGAGVQNIISNGSADMYLLKLDTNGDFQWVRRMGGNSFDQIRSIHFDGGGGIYSTGFFQETVDFDPGIGVENDTAIGSSDIFIHKIDTSGTFQWVKHLPGLSVSSQGRGISIVSDASGNVYTSGEFRSEIDFDPGGAISSLNAGYNDGFLHSMQPCVSLISTVQDTACDSYLWSVNSMNYDSTGVYTDTLTALSGCDSIVVLDLTILYSSSSSQTEIACDSFLWATNNQTYTSSGTYTDTLTNSLGCDSIVTLDLTINLSNTSLQTETVCDSFHWSANNTTYGASGVYVDTLSTVTGCDSVVTLDLTVYFSSSAYHNEVACDSFNWSVNNVTYTSSGIYVDTISNNAGCDSVVTLDLTVNNSSTNTISEVVCDYFVWTANGNTYDTSGVYTDTLINSLGCDSVVTLNLMVNHSDSTLIDEVACGQYIWAANAQPYSESGTYIETLTNALGCDSTVTLHLTINSVDTSLSIVGSTLFAQANNAGFQWLTCDGEFSVLIGDTNASFHPTQNGFYAVEITDSSCVDTSRCVNITSVGVQSYSGRFNPRIYPNPTRSNIIVDYSQNAISGSILVIDALGRQVVRKEVFQTSLIDLNTEKLANGLYIIRIEGDQIGTSFHQFIKQ